MSADHKQAGVMHTSNSVSFEINGIPYTAYGNQYDVSMNLNRFIREVAGLSGTKVMCQEAGCGCCAVTVTLVKPGDDKQKSYSINSCLCPLYCIDGWQITTVEGLGNHREGFHPIQDRLAKFNGSQCGYCSPGMVMNMYGVLSNNSRPTKAEIEDSFGGNICRCTGYRPILDAMKSFATDSNNEKYGPIDIEDVNKYLCPRTGEPCTGAGDGIHVSDLELTINHGKQKWYRPTSLDKLRELMMQYADKKLKLLFGNTAAGIFKDEAPSDIYIDLHGIPELYVKETGAMFNLGANHTIQDLLEIFSEHSSLEGFGYFADLANHISRIGSLPQRNAGSWAGNLMLKNIHNDFPSDIYVMFDAAGAQIEILDVKNGFRRIIGLEEFLSVDMYNKVILAIKLYKHEPNDRFRSFKIMPRSQNAHAYVNAGFRFTMNPAEKGQIVGHPSVVYGGINEILNNAKETEYYLAGKNLLHTGVIETACSILESELEPTEDPVLSSSEYRRNLAVNLLYKTLLGLLDDENIEDSRYRSAALDIHRPVSHATQEYQTKDDEFPVKQPMPKLTAPLQTSGEAQFINDRRMQQSELHGALVLATVGNCYIDTVDASQALRMPGVARYITANDIPSENTYIPKPPPFNMGKAELFSSGYIGYAGQALGMILADSHDKAVKAARNVTVTYKDHKPVILTIEQAIEQQLTMNPFPDLISGDPEDSMSSATHTVTGEVSAGDQAHFYMETQITLCVPNEECLDVYPSTQWPSGSQSVAAAIISKPLNSVNVEVQRIGGAFGGKAISSGVLTTAAALGTHLTGRPVRVNVNLNDNMEFSGKRSAFLVKYQVGFDDEGRLMSVIADIFVDCGYVPAFSFISIEIASHFEQGYFIPNVKLKQNIVTTHKPVSEPYRGPGPFPASLVIETILEHVAKSLNKDPLLVKELNLYSEGQKTPRGHELTYCSARRLWQELKVWAEVGKRQNEIKEFNKNNIWRKRGIAMTATKYGMQVAGIPFQAFVAIYAKDGTVAVSVGGVEMGQGLYTKVGQAAAAALGVPIDFIKLKSTNILIGANMGPSGGSVTSEINVKAVVEACRELHERIDPLKVKNPDLDWPALIRLCFKQGIELTSKHTAQAESSGQQFDYYTYCAGVTESEVDVLTGESVIRRVDILFDCGESLNPEIDIGQIEGAFVMGLGSWLHETLIFDDKTGRLLNNGTWEYKPPTTKDIPIDWRIKLLSDAPNPVGILRSKASGEPPICLSCGAVFALKHAIEDFREDFLKKKEYFELGRMPLTVEKTQLLCKVPINRLCLP